MPKVTITFDLPEEAEEHRQVVNAGKAFSALEGVREGLRQWRKYGHKFKNKAELLEATERLFYVETEGLFED